MGFNVIFGAGKIARGFIAHLLYLSNEDFVFIDKSESLVNLINQRKQYTVNIFGAPQKNANISNVRAIAFQYGDLVTEALTRADAIFTAVGGKNLSEIIPLLAKGIEARFEKGNNNVLNIITCENWKIPADILRNGILELLDKKYLDSFMQNVGITEAVVMRSAVEADKYMLEKDPLVVNVQDYWELPVDASRIKGCMEKIHGVKLIESFQGFLERKFYTYNAANGTVSYLGYLKGYEKIADAAHDAEILEILMGVYEETGKALSEKYGFTLEDQMNFAKTSLQKLQDYNIVDFIERNARDPIRKLGRDDRLVGSARLVLDFGFIPHNLAAAICAALFYDNPIDPVALELKATRESHGIDYVLEKICKIDSHSALANSIRAWLDEFRERGWIKQH